jgi:hypothetical protein
MQACAPRCLPHGLEGEPRRPSAPRPRPTARPRPLVPCLDAADGSLHRTARHGWGDTTLLYHTPGLGPHASSGAPPRRGLAPPPPGPPGGRRGLFGTLSGAEAGGADAWLGNPLIDPAKGRRAAAAPRDPKGRQGLASVLSLANPGEAAWGSERAGGVRGGTVVQAARGLATACIGGGHYKRPRMPPAPPPTQPHPPSRFQTLPGRPDDDSWLGNIGIDPARGRGHSTRPARGRATLFPVVQPDRPPAGWEGPGAAGAAAALRDAWMGNPRIDPAAGRRGPRGGSGGSGGGDGEEAALPAAAAEHLWGAVFRDAAPPAARGREGPGGAWSDLPRIGRRPLPDPVTAAGVEARAWHALRQGEPLPPGVRAPGGRNGGKAAAPLPARAGAVGAYALLTFKDPAVSAPGGGGCEGGGDAARWRRAWDDAPRQPRRGRGGRSGGGSGGGEGGEGGGGGGGGGPGLLDWSPNRTARFVPFGGLAQERGLNLNAIAAIASIARGAGTGAARKGASGGGGGGGGGGSRGASGARRGGGGGS